MSSRHTWEGNIALLELHSVDVCYGDVHVLHGVNLRVHDGEAVTVVGANGAGKSTLLKTISGLLHVRSGSISFNGEKIDILPAHRIVEMGLSNIAEGRRIFSLLTVLENLKLGAYVSEARKHRKESLEWIFQFFPILRERKSQLAGTLSGGEQQMLAIARGLMLKPKLLMLDEPSLGLAPIIVDEVFKKIKEIHEQGISILLVEQNTYRAMNLAERGYVLENGRIVLEGASNSLLRNEYVRKAYIGL